MIMENRVIKFRDITVGDEIYFIKKNASLLESKDQYGNVYSANLVNREVVKRLDLDNNSKFVNRSANRNDWFLLEIKEAALGSCFLETDSNIFFSNYSDYKKAVSDFILSKIAEYENSISEHERAMNKKIELMREAYYDYLNNTGFILTNPDLLK